MGHTPESGKGPILVLPFLSSPSQPCIYQFCKKIHCIHFSDFGDFSITPCASLPPVLTGLLRNAQPQWGG